MKRIFNKKNLSIAISLICIIIIALIIASRVNTITNRPEVNQRKSIESIDEKSSAEGKNNIQNTISIQEDGNQINTLSNENTNNNIDTSKWDLTKVNIVYDTNNVAVPVPKGYIASGADNEHTVTTGFVIYEGETEVTNENCWEESCSRNQWVWVPVQDPSRLYEVTSSGKKIAKTYNYNQNRKNTNR